MKLLPINVDESKNMHFRAFPPCNEVLDVYPGYYQKVGYNEPWIGYFASIDGNDIVGSGGYKGKPINGKVEIAYTAFKPHEGKGIGTEICRQLVLLSLKTDPSIRITARTLTELNASTQILLKNGFECTGIVFDEDDGYVWEWELIKKDE